MEVVREMTNNVHCTVVGSTKNSKVTKIVPLNPVKSLCKKN